MSLNKAVAEKYRNERDKRLRADGVAQYVIPSKHKEYTDYLHDPNVQIGTPINRPVEDGGRCKVLIVGAGFGGILFAVKLLKTGLRLEDILLVDVAGGFGGTWWWNRFVPPLLLQGCCSPPDVGCHMQIPRPDVRCGIVYLHAST